MVEKGFTHDCVNNYQSVALTEERLKIQKNYSTLCFLNEALQQEYKGDFDIVAQKRLGRGVEVAALRQAMKKYDLHTV